LLTEKSEIQDGVAGSVHNYRFTWFDWFCLWYPPGWLILFNRHWQHYHADPDGWNWLEYLLFLVPGGFYLAWLIRWLRLGCRRPSSEGSKFDPNYQKAFADEIIGAIANHYFRIELKGVENLPANGPAIVAMNHAGMCFPWDFLGLAYALNRSQGWVVQPLAHMAIFDHPWVVWWLPPGWSDVLGGVRADAEHFEAALAEKTILLYAPEGGRGPAKGWLRRDRLQTFHPSFIRLSQQYRIPILPVLCLGSEFLHPWAIGIDSLAKKLRLPFFPVSGLMVVFILFPSMGVWAMRTRLKYVVQPPYQPLSAAKDVAISQNRTAYQQAQTLREDLQAQIDKLKKRSGDSNSAIA
jgi:1-acyl-sn-glycerol-3-phosphate acyltransferase